MDETSDTATVYFRRVVARIHVAAARWRDSPADPSALAELRDSFSVLCSHSHAHHAGRLYDVCKSVSNLLSRLADQTVNFDVSMVELLDDVIEYVGGHWNTFADGSDPGRQQVNFLMERADLLASGGFDCEDEESYGLAVEPPEKSESAAPAPMPAGLAMRSPEPPAASRESSEEPPVPRSDGQTGHPPPAHGLPEAAALVREIREDVKRLVERTARLEEILETLSAPEPAIIVRGLKAPSDPEIAASAWLEGLIASLSRSMDRKGATVEMQAGTRDLTLGRSLADYLEQPVAWLIRLIAGLHGPRLSPGSIELEDLHTIVERVLERQALRIVVRKFAAKPEPEEHGHQPGNTTDPDTALFDMPAALAARLHQTGSSIRFATEEAGITALDMELPLNLRILECQAFTIEGDQFLLPTYRVIEVTSEPLGSGDRELAGADFHSKSEIVGSGSRSGPKHRVVAALEDDVAVALPADAIGSRTWIAVPKTGKEGALPLGTVTLENGECAMLIDPATFADREG